MFDDAGETLRRLSSLLVGLSYEGVLARIGWELIDGSPVVGTEHLVSTAWVEIANEVLRFDGNEDFTATSVGKLPHEALCAATTKTVEHRQSRRVPFGDGSQRLRQGALTGSLTDDDMQCVGVVLTARHGVVKFSP